MQTPLGVLRMMKIWKNGDYRVECVTNNIIELEELVDTKTIDEGRTLRRTLIRQIA